METDDAADGDGDNAAAAAAELDFSRLKRQHLGTDTPAERDKVAAELESGIEETKAQLERVAPNLKVGPQVTEQLVLDFVPDRGLRHDNVRGLPAVSIWHPDGADS